MRLPELCNDLFWLINVQPAVHRLNASVHGQGKLQLWLNTKLHTGLKHGSDYFCFLGFFFVAQMNCSIDDSIIS